MTAITPEVLHDDNSAIQAMISAEVDTQISTAKRFPRSIQKAQDRLNALVTMDETTAAGCTYRISRGGKAFDGPSIRFAEAVAVSWGNLRYGARVVSKGARQLQAQGVCHDLENNVSISIDVETRISYKDKRGRNGEVIPGGRYNDDMIAVAGNAACAKALRNAILKVVPKTFWGPAWEQSKQTALGNKATLSKRRGDALSYLADKHGVSRKRVFAAIDVTGEREIDLYKLRELRELVQAINDDEVSIETAFPQVESAADKAKGKTEKSRESSKSAEPDPVEASTDPLARPDDPEFD